MSDPAPTMSRRLRSAMPVGVALFAVALLYRRLVAGRVLAGGDLQIYFFPYWATVARSLQDMQLPLWNPYLFTGAPLLANSQVGVFYPLNWPFWWLARPGLWGVARALHASVLLHVGFAAWSVYVLGRATGLRRWGAALAGVVYAGGGFVGTHLDHLNQLQGLAWLPLLFLPAVSRRRGRDRGVLTTPRGLSILALTMIVLSGHTQMAFIAGVALLIWHAAQVALSSPAMRWSRSGLVAALGQWAVRLVPFGFAGVVAAVQLLPTAQLARYSGRSGGMAWREAVSFSVPPWELHRALLPPYVTSLLLPEGVAYVGIAGLMLLGLAVATIVRRRDRMGLAWLILTGAGIFFALGGYNPLYLLAVRLGVPGLAHFRAPARFLALYALGSSWLIGLGLDWLTTWLRPRPRAVRGGVVSIVVALMIAELLLSAESLPHASATPARAYTDLRPATAQLVAATASDTLTAAPHRLLSVTQTLFEIGDRSELESVYGRHLSEASLWSFLVAAKQREVLVPNLPLAFEVPAADGYDGGLLPLRHYSDFSQLLVPGGTLDGRLRENLQGIPDARWLALMGVRFVLTDKTLDTWVDGVFYDRQFQPHLEAGEQLRIAWLPEDFTATGLGLLYEGTGEVTLEFAGGETMTLPLPARHGEAGAYRLAWPEADRVAALTFEVQTGSLTLTGASLVDERLDAFYPLVLSDKFWLVHSGDVKIYETLSPPPRAFVAHACQIVSTVPEALMAIQDTAHSVLQRAVVLASDSDEMGDEAEITCGESAVDGTGDSITFRHYGPTRIVMDVTTTAPGLLVLTDAWYPGWVARIAPLTDGAPQSPDARAPLLRADILFRAVPVAPGSWRVTLTYVPAWLAVGAGVSLLGMIGLLVYARRSRVLTP